MLKLYTQSYANPTQTQPIRSKGVSAFRSPAQTKSVVAQRKALAVQEKKLAEFEGKTTAQTPAQKKAVAELAMKLGKTAPVKIVKKISPHAAAVSALNADHSKALPHDCAVETKGAIVAILLMTEIKHGVRELRPVMFSYDSLRDQSRIKTIRLTRKNELTVVSHVEGLGVICRVLNGFNVYAQVLIPRSDLFVIHCPLVD